MKKIVCFLILGLFILNGCSSNMEEQNKEVENKDKVLEITSEYDYAYDLSDNYSLNEHHDTIALVEITEVEGCSNFNQKLQTYVDIFTYGKAKVKDVYKGNLKAGETIDFTRLGGQIPYSEWKKGLNERQLQRIQEEEYTAVISKYDHDIDVEKGKTYLVFLDHTTSQNENEYAITGFAYGMREVKDSGTLTKSSDVLVKNNITGEYEALSEVVISE